MPGQYRQGDVLLCGIERIPSAAYRVPVEGERVVVAEGELSGHAHAFAPKGVRLFRDKKAHRAFSRSGNTAPSSGTRSTGRYRSPRGVTRSAGSANIPRARRAWFGIDPDAGKT